MRALRGHPLQDHTQAEIRKVLQTGRRGAKPLGAKSGGKTGKKGSDKGIDGVINFVDDNSGRPKRVLVQVKSGKVKSGDIRDLRGTVEREDAAMGVFNHARRTKPGHEDGGG